MRVFLYALAVVCCLTFVQVTFVGSAVASDVSQMAFDKLERSYDPQIAVKDQKRALGTWFCDIKIVKLEAQDPLTQRPGAIQLRVYTPRTAKRLHDLKDIVLVPPTGGENPIDRAYARDFCRNNFQVAIVEHWDGDDPKETDLGMHDRAMYQQVGAIRHAVEFFGPVHSTQVGILGTSLGAISSAVTIGHEPRIFAAALIVGGGGLAEVNATSNEQILIDLRAKTIADLGLNGQVGYEEALRVQILLDPLTSVPKTQVKHLFMMIGERDLTVPTVNQYKLLNAFPKDTKVELKTFNGNHVQTIIYTYLTQSKNLVNFFEASLNP